MYRSRACSPPKPRGSVTSCGLSHQFRALSDESHCGLQILKAQERASAQALTAMQASADTDACPGDEDRIVGLQEQVTALERDLSASAALASAKEVDEQEAQQQAKKLEVR